MIPRGLKNSTRIQFFHSIASLGCYNCIIHGSCIKSIVTPRRAPAAGNWHFNSLFLILTNQKANFACQRLFRNSAVVFAAHLDVGKSTHKSVGAHCAMSALTHHAEASCPETCLSAISEALIDSLSA